MLNIVLLVSSLVVALVSAIARKYFMDKNFLGVAGSFIFNTICSFIAGIVLLFWGGIGDVSTYTVIWGTVYGIVAAFQGVTFMLALETGPLSYTMVISSCSSIIPALSGLMFFGEDIGWSHIVGIILMVLCFIFATEKDKSKQKANFIWFILCIVIFFLTGFVGIIQKIHQNSPSKGELNLFLIVAFAVSSVLSLIVSLVLTLVQKRKNTPETDSAEKAPAKNGSLIFMILIMVFCGICYTINNKFNLYLSGVMPSAVFFPIINGGGLILTSLAAFIIFREKLSKAKLFGLIFGILSVIFLCNPFNS
ncbi:MAG: hypothetical protein IKT70_04035 [Clostridia bacterium]|nr:hypothetical protein [Clostridia bacterium]